MTAGKKPSPEDNAVEMNSMKNTDSSESDTVALDKIQDQRVNSETADNGGDTAPNESKDNISDQSERKAEKGHNRLENIIQRESSLIRKTTARKEIIELQKQRRETIRKLHELRTSIEQERESLEAKSHFFSTLMKELQEIPEEIEETSLRDLRQAVNNAHMETLKFERRKNDSRIDSAVKNQANNDWQNISFSQLTRIGLGLLWPLAIALLLTGAGIGTVVYIIFSF